MSLDALIRQKLDAIYDPCSVAAGRPKGLLEMGLVLDWAFTAPGRLNVRFCMTFTGCTMAPHFMEAARESLETLPGVSAVETELDTGFLWTPDRMRA